MDLIDQLTRKQIQLRENLEKRKFAQVGLQNFLSLQEIEDGIRDGSIDAKAYWEFEVPALLEVPLNLSEESRRHWQASLTQVAYFRHQLNEYSIENKEIGNAMKRALHHNKSVIALSETLGWGFYHWAYAEDFYGRRERVFAERAKRGGSASSLRRQEEDAILSGLVKAQLEHHPERKRGWENIDDTSRVLAKAIERIADEQHFPIRKKGDELLDAIFVLLDEADDVRSVYDGFSRSRSRSRR